MLTKTDLVQTVSSAVKVSRRQAAGILNALLETIEAAVAKGEDVRIVGFGTFTVRERAARKGRSPATGQEIVIPAKRVVVFRPGKELRAAVASGVVRVR